MPELLRFELCQELSRLGGGRAASGRVSLGEELATEDSAAFHLVVDGEARDLHPIIRDELYRITREALRNAFSHANAHHIEIEITYGEQAFRLRIRDDGDGLPANTEVRGRQGHYAFRE